MKHHTHPVASHMGRVSPDSQHSRASESYEHTIVQKYAPPTDPPQKNTSFPIATTLRAPTCFAPELHDTSYPHLLPSPIPIHPFHIRKVKRLASAPHSEKHFTRSPQLVFRGKRKTSENRNSGVKPSLPVPSPSEPHLSPPSNRSNAYRLRPPVPE